MSIVVAGHICLDMIPNWQEGGINSIKPGHLVEMEGVDFSTGGAVANTGLALNKLGLNTSLIGKIGDDYIGEIILEIMREKSINNKDITENMIISRDETSSYTVILEPPDTDRIFLHAPGTNHTFVAHDLQMDKIKAADLFHFGYPPLMESIYKNNGKELVKIFNKAKDKGLITSLDMAMPDPESEAGKVDWESILERTLPEVDIFLPSLQEVMYMLNYENYDVSEENLKIDLIQDIGTQLLNMGAKIVVLKLGTQGLYLQTTNMNKTNAPELFNLINKEKWSELQWLTPSFQVDVKGTTGAGDSAIAGFLAQISRGEDPAKTLNTAAAVGACCVEGIDASEGIIPLKQVERRIKKGWSKLPVDLDMKNWQYDKKAKIWKPS